jgi:hypothetical protein
MLPMHDKAMERFVDQAAKFRFALAQGVLGLPVPSVGRFKLQHAAT